MLTLVSTFFNKINSYLILGLIIGLISSIGYIKYQNGMINGLDTEIVRLNNNNIQYLSIMNDYGIEKRALQLKLSDLNTSNDKLIQEINNSAKRLKVAQNSLKSAAIIKTSIDTILVTKVEPIDTLACDFTATLEPNSLTTIIIERKSDSLYCKPNIENQVSLLNYNKKEYRNQRKNWLSRLIHWDWKKDEIDRYELENTNNLIKNTDVRVIKIVE